MKQHVILIFDIGKTNKKYYLLDEDYHELECEYIQFPKIKDDNAFDCDDLQAISNWVLTKYRQVKSNDKYELRFVNFSTYGATLVHLNKNGKPCTDLYNYLKPFPQDIKELFRELHGDIDVWSMQTSSPYLGMLNAGLQLFWLKHKKPGLFKEIVNTVFLPQYLSYLLTGKLVTEFTGLGCHTGMWDFCANDYHAWMYKEKLVSLLPTIVPTFYTSVIPGTTIKTGVGIHDSSAALIPYIKNSVEPFILLSTGTWSICLNPFNVEPLTIDELKQDCLCFLQPNGKQVKASRFFMGGLFSECVRRLNKLFDEDEKYHERIALNDECYQAIPQQKSSIFFEENNNEKNYRVKNFTADGLNIFENYEAAYHHLILELINIQKEKIYFAKGSSFIRKIYVDGGFAKNKIFLTILQKRLPEFEFIASENPLASTLGAAAIMKEN